jgi:hypothetical protein
MKRRATFENFIECAWFKNLPPKVQDAARQYPPGLYRMMTTGQIVKLVCYTENQDGSCDKCRVQISPEYEPTCIFPREVFGIKLKYLKRVHVIE